MKFGAFLTELDRSGLRPLYALAGPEAYWRDRGWRAISSAALASDPTAECRTIDPTSREEGATFDLARCLADLATPSLFATRHCLRLRPATGQLGGWTEALLAYLNAPPADATLVLDLERLDGRTRMARSISPRGSIVECKALFSSPPPWSQAPPHDHDLARWVVAETRARSKTIGMEEAHRLTLRVGGNLFVLEQEIEKLVSYVGDRPGIETADIDRLTGASRKEKLFELSDAVLERRTGEALDRTRRLFEEGFVGKNGRPVLLPAAIALATAGHLATRFRRIHEVWLLLHASGGRIDSQDVASELGIKPFAAQRSMAQARRLDRERFVALFAELDRCDRDLKSSAGPADWILTRTVCRLAATATA